MGTLTRVRFESTTLELSPLLSSRPGSFNDQGTVSQKSRKLAGLTPLMSLQRRDSKPSNLVTLLVRGSFLSKNTFFMTAKWFSVISLTGWKNLEQKLIFQLGTLLHKESMNASHSTNLFTTSCDDIFTNGKAPLHSYINHNNPQFLYSLWRRANARNVSFLNLSRW